MSEALYAERPGVYDALYAEKPYDAEVEWVLEQFERLGNGGERALVVGCGTGEHSRRLTEQGFDVTGVDRYEAMVERARTKSDAEFRVDRLPDLSVEGAYDLVWSPFTVLNHVASDDAEPAVRAMVRRVADGGVLVADVLEVSSTDGGPHLSTYQAPDGEYARLTQIHHAEGDRHDYESLVVTPDGEVFVDTHEYYDHDDAFIEGVLAGAGLSVTVRDWYGLEGVEEGTVFLGVRSAAP